MRKFGVRTTVLAAMCHTTTPLQHQRRTQVNIVPPSNQTVPFPEHLKKDESPQPAPLLYQVPTFTNAIHGRDRDLFQMWQRLLNGKRIHIVTGVDGIGKTSFTAAFAEHAKRSQRFSCIHWFHGHEDVVSQMREFLAEVNGRNEKHVLLLFDQVADVSAIVALIPPSLDFYAVINASGDAGYRPFDACFAGGRPYETPKETTFLKATAKQKAELTPHTTSFQLGSIDQKDAVQFIEERCDTLLGEALSPLADRLGGVPLLLELACAILSATEAPTSVDALLKLLDANAPVGEEGLLSVTSTARCLVGELIRLVSLRQGDVDPLLSNLALLNTEDINPGVVGALAGDDAERAHEILKDFNRLKIVSFAWDQEDSYRVHPLVAKILRERPGTDPIKAANAVFSLWPRRWRGSSETTALSIVGHTIALRSSLVPADHPVDKSLASEFRSIPPLAQCFDRAATYLSEVAGKRLETATALWYNIFQSQMDLPIETLLKDGDGENAARVAADLGKLMYRSHDPRCAIVLARAFDLASQVYGRDAATTAMVLVYRAKFLSETAENVKLLSSTAHKLSETCTNDKLLSLEDEKMQREGVFVLLVAAAKLSEAVKEGPEAADFLWKSIEKAQESLEGTLEKIKARDNPKRR